MGWGKARRALMVVDMNTCPDCGGPLEAGSTDQLALFRHRGFGAAERTTHRVCVNKECGWTLVVEHGHVKP